MKRPTTACLLTLLLVFGPMVASAQVAQDSLGPHPVRLKAVAYGESALAIGSLGGLYTLWYSGYDQSPFHGINDNAEWLQMDKGGHMITSYYLSKLSWDMLSWAGLDRRKALWYSAPIGFTYLGIVEVMDGFSEAWGASAGDLIANASGTLLFTAQQAAWDEQRVQLKWSFHRTPYAAYRPSALGSNILQEMIKDYNGQSLWLSFNLWSLSGRPGWMPDWLNMAVGYSADGMLGARTNPSDLPHYERRRQFYLSPDIDLSRVETGREWLDLSLDLLNFIKVPMPALELDSRGRLSFYPLYL